MSEFPKVFRLRQKFATTHVENVEAETERQLARLQLAQRVSPGQTVAITAGSRGIANIHLITRAVVRHFQALGAQPFLVPAMGSHGGGTVAGQLEQLRNKSLTEEFCGCPIRASMETVVVCQAAEGFPVHFDRHAFGAHHVVVVGRVKPHTGFVGEIESGLMKMMLIGLGKLAGAKIYHRAIVNYSFGQILASVAREVLARCRILCGLAIVENGYDETACLEAVAPADFENREKHLLRLARELLPRLPFREADVLLVDEFGKNISGTGIDTNVVGRKFNDHAALPDEWPKIRRIALRSLTPQSDGNATGMGIAEFCRSQVLAQADLEKTAINCITGNHPTAAMAPIACSNDRELLAAALATIGLVEPPAARLQWIRNTLCVAELACSEAYLPEAKGRDDLEILGEPAALKFDAQGNLPPFVA